MTRAVRYLREPVVLTRGTILAVLAVLGVLAGTGAVLGAQAVTGLADERSARGDAERDALKRDLTAKIDVARRDARHAQRIARLERPSDAAIVQRILRALRVARRNPTVRRRLEALGLHILPAPPSRSPVPFRPPERRSPVATTNPPHRQPAAPSPTPRPDPSPPAGPPSPPPASPPQRPPVDVQTPNLPLPAPSVCLPPLGGINCP